MRRLVLIVISVLTLILPISGLYAQDNVVRNSPVTAQCGEAIEGEFSSNFQENVYAIEVKAGDAFEATVAPVGTQLKTFMIVTGPTNL